MVTGCFGNCISCAYRKCVNNELVIILQFNEECCCSVVACCDGFCSGVNSTYCCGYELRTGSCCITCVCCCNVGSISYARLKTSQCYCELEFLSLVTETSCYVLCNYEILNELIIPELVSFQFVRALCKTCCCVSSCSGGRDSYLCEVVSVVSSCCCTAVVLCSSDLSQIWLISLRSAFVSVGSDVVNIYAVCCVAVCVCVVTYINNDEVFVSIILNTGCICRMGDRRGAADLQEIAEEIARGTKMVAELEKMDLSYIETF